MSYNPHRIVPAAYLVLFKGNQVLLSRRFNTGYEDGNYSLIAGHVEKGDPFTQTIVREAQEEAGLKLQPENLKVAHIMHRNTKNEELYERIDVFFLTEKCDGEAINQEPDKCDDLAWFDLNNLPPNLIPYIREALFNIQNQIHYSEYGWDS